ncbi:MAG: hypothetical protein ABFD60_05155, partial [Bryobacteraceae bacterium]
PLILMLLSVSIGAAEKMDIAPFAHPCCSQSIHSLQTTFDYNHPRGLVRTSDGSGIYGLQWAEERDIFAVDVRFKTKYEARKTSVEYWSRYWPHNPPRMPTIEDPVDDPWQGQWIKAKTDVSCQGPTCHFTFAPLDSAENPLAKNLPDIPYRRTVRFRLVFLVGDLPLVESVRVFSQSEVRRVGLRVLLNVGASAAKKKSRFEFHAYNGWIRDVEQIEGGALLTVDAADPKPAGSNDITVVTVTQGNESFSFSPSDAEKGPIYVPDFHAYVTLSSDREPFSKEIVKRGALIRERLAMEPEQTYERASREIPALDPVERQGGRLYLPMAADASWQKFAFEWGGNVRISKRGTKAYGREVARLTWPGDSIRWMIGTGDPATFRPRSGDSTLSVLDGYLPVGTARWSSGSIDYEQEAFATMLEGPLSSEDQTRSEQTPAVLLMRVRARNRGASPETAHLWLRMEPEEALAWDGALLTADQGRSVRASVRMFAGGTASADLNGVHGSIALRGGQESTVFIAIPFMPGLTTKERSGLAQLDYNAERARVVEYWRSVSAQGIPFRTPEERFNIFAKGLVCRIRISATKDPHSGLYMVPAASYNYKVYANEAVFQSQLLDVIGYHPLARRYLNTWPAVQGSKPFRGSYTDQRGVYHGAKTGDEYDYTASNYNLDHGTVLWSLAEHYWMTRDKSWLKGVTPSLKKAADWIIEQRKLTKVMAGGTRCPEYGLLPAGHLEDNGDWGHWFSVNAYASLGLSEMAKALVEIGDPEATRYRREADLYRSDLRRAVDRAVADAPVIRLRDNTYVPYVPTRVHQRIRMFGPLRTSLYSRYPQRVLPTYRLSATRELLYGPMILVDTGIYDANESLARWVIDDWDDNVTMSEPLGLHVHGWVDENMWFSRGGMVFQANLQNPIRAYLRRGEARAAIRHLYNNFVSCYYPTVNVFTEEYRQWRSPSGPFYKVPDEAKFVHRLRDMIVTEYNNDLLLAVAIPERWLAPGQDLVVNDAPTHYGSTSFTLRGDVSEVRGTVELPQRNPYRDAWLTVRVPGGRRLGPVLINGKPWSDIDVKRSRIRLPKLRAPMSIVVKTR